MVAPVPPCATDTTVPLVSTVPLTAGSVSVVAVAVDPEERVTEPPAVDPIFNGMSASSCAGSGCEDVVNSPADVHRNLVRHRIRGGR